MSSGTPGLVDYIHPSIHPHPHPHVNTKANIEISEKHIDAGLNRAQGYVALMNFELFDQTRQAQI